MQHRAVGDFLGQGVLEDILDLRKRRLLVEKLFALEGGEEAIEFLFGLGDDLAEQAQRELAPNDGQLLQEGFLFGGQAVDAGRQHALHGGGDMQLGRRFLQPVACRARR